jgi:hypothetical protein
VKRLVAYLAGIGLGAAAGMAVYKRTSPPELGDKPRKAKPSGGLSDEGGGKLGSTLKRALEEGKRVMKETEAELTERAAAASDGL